jgi:hypothetical protein
MGSNHLLEHSYVCRGALALYHHEPLCGQLQLITDSHTNTAVTYV